MTSVEPILAAVGLQHYLVLGAFLFVCGLMSIMLKRNAIGILMGVELVLNAANVNLVAFNYYSYRGSTGSPALDGQIFVGLLANESGASVTLIGQDGKEIPLLRAQLDELRSTGKSLMPEGLEKDIGAQQFADVIAYIQSASIQAAPEK